MRTLLTLTFALSLSACGIVELPESADEVAVYYVSTNYVDSLRDATNPIDASVGLATLVAIEYETPDGTAFDTLRSPDTPSATSWTKTFPRDALSTFALTATNLTPSNPADTLELFPDGFIGVSLLVNQEIVAADSSRSVVTLSN